MAKARQFQSTEATRRRRWEELQVKNALQSVPNSVTGELRLMVDAEVRDALESRGPDDDEAVTRELVSAARDKALSPCGDIGLQPMRSRCFHMK